MVVMKITTTSNTKCVWRFSDTFSVLIMITTHYIHSGTPEDYIYNTSGGENAIISLVLSKFIPFISTTW